MVPKVRRALNLTAPLYHDTPTNPRGTPPQIGLMTKLAVDGWLVETLSMHTHQGTHMDAPAHHEANMPAIDAFTAEQLQGVGVVVDLRRKGANELIGPEDFTPYEHLVVADCIPVLCTGWCRKRSWSREWLYHSPALSEAGARWLLERGIRGAGVDHFSIGGQGSENEGTHHILLSGGIWVVEDLDIPDAFFEQETWHIIALPLYLRGCGGAPARVIALDYEE
jgi:arylformamidase